MNKYSWKMIAAGVLLAVVAAGCGPKKPVLHIYTWSDYVKPELIQRFERENGCAVAIATP